MTERPTVVHLVVAGDIGGAERLLVELASRPGATGARHVIALFTPNPRLAAMLEEAGLDVRAPGRVREGPLAYLWRSFGPKDLAWLVALLRGERASILHLHTFASHVLGARAALAAKVRSLRTEHHIQYFVDPSTSAFTRWSLGRVDRTVAISRYVEAFVAKTAPEVRPRLRTVRNGVDSEYFSPRPPRAEGEFVFAVVCRLERWKHVDRVVTAMAEVPGARLVVAGDGSERGGLERLAAARGVGDRVRFLGHLPDPRDAIAGADAGVNASDDEPLGLSVLEAMAMGKPVIAFAGGAMPELITPGDRGWLAATRTTSGLAAVLREAATSRERARDMGARARQFVERECAIETMCAGYRTVYDELLSLGPPG